MKKKEAEIRRKLLANDCSIFPCYNMMANWIVTVHIKNGSNSPLHFDSLEDVEKWLERWIERKKKDTDEDTTQKQPFTK